MRSSPKVYTDRPIAANQAARVAWDVLTKNGERVPSSMLLLDGLWICVFPDGLRLDYVEADVVAVQTRRSLLRLQKALDRRAAQGRA